jgi:chemotaxis protein MotA
MIVIVGCIVVMAAVMGGFTMAGGHVHSLIHPSEIVTIGGAALGALIVMSPKQVLIDLLKGMLQAVKGSPYGRKAYGEMFGALYELFRLAYREGMLVLEPHLSDPHQSRIFSAYPTLAKNHHALELICESLKMVVDGAVKPEQMPQLFAAELRAIEEEHHGPLNVITKTADALPGFGIVAAVLGIVITMGAIDGPVEEIGHKVGAALVGTFLGILLSYGFFAPLAVKMEFVGVAEMAYFRAITEAITAFVDNVQPKVAIERARRGVGRDVRPTPEELLEVFKQAEAAVRT